MELRELKSLVHEMRIAQKAYFKASTPQGKEKYLIKSKLLEKRVDIIVTPSLFDNK